MCGIVGLFSPQSMPSAADFAQVVDTLRHRGPDDSGVWQDENAGLLLGHTRLSIIDLSCAGHQPMISANSRYVIVFNGEIYNHLELRERLAQREWTGHSDTETLLACINAWGLEKTLHAVVGMFAFGLWDRETRRLLLARDRFGEKPLYYGYVGNSFAFASELKPLRRLPGFSGEIDRAALAAYMRHNTVPSPLCIYRGLAKLPPGSWVELSSAALRQKEKPQPRSYWSAIDAAAAGVANPLAFGSDDEAIDALERVLGAAVRAQSIADVPLGAFLSGGIDSSAIVALMQAQSNTVKSFSIGFSEGHYDESAHASAVARHLGTDHTEFHVTPSDALGVIPRLPSMYDEPFGDSSQIPTYLVAAMAREQVTVALSGDGGDELFGGYNRHVLSHRLANTIFRLPVAVRRLAATGITAISPSAWDGVFRTLGTLLPRQARLALPGEKLHKGASTLRCVDGPALYRQLVSHWEPDSVVLGTQESIDESAWSVRRFPHLAEQMMAMDAATYLTDDILTKVDRAAMATSLEVRVPFLDHRVFEFAWRLPLSMKLRDGEGKWILRQLLYRRIPKELLERPKMGFGVPIDVWLRGPLRGWAADLLSESRLTREGYFNPTPIREKWAEHISGKRNWQHHLWDVLMFQAWLDTQGV